MTRYDILLDKKPPELLEKPDENQSKSPDQNYIDIPRLPRQELFPDDEYKGAGPLFGPVPWTKWKNKGKFTDEYYTLIYRRPIK